MEKAEAGKSHRPGIFLQGTKNRMDKSGGQPGHRPAKNTLLKPDQKGLLNQSPSRLYTGVVAQWDYLSPLYDGKGSTIRIPEESPGIHF